MRAAALAGAIALAATPAIANAQTRSYNIEAKSLSQALKEFGRTSGHHLLFQESLVRGKTSTGLKGSYDTNDALARLLQGTGLEAQRTANGSIVIRPAAAAPGKSPAGSTAAEIEDAEIVVTGTHIAGSTQASPVITIRAQDMHNAGQYQLGDVARSIPQNFNGGQNPGVLFGSPNSADLNVNSATAVNLRGLGVDATLTLLNGKRLAYDSAIEAIDLSAIPVAAVDRMEVLTEGASAVYGSDAVAGVVNIVLKKDYQGINASARVGGSTAGGNLENQFSLVGGQRWEGGGFLIAGDYGRNSAVYAGDRSAASNMNESSTLFPRQSHYGLLATGYQRLGDLIFDVDAFYNRRNSFFTSALTKAADYRFFGNSADTKIDSFVVSPRVRLDLGAAWSISLQGSYGQDRTEVELTNYRNGLYSSTGISRYRNDLVTAELSASGKLFALPGGDAKIAVGTGYRRNALDSDQRTVTATAVIPGTHITPSRNSVYLYAETDLPIISPDNDIGGVNRFALTAAVRYEKYRNIGDIATPKLGLVYSPIDGLTFRGSWGRSFKAPTMRQLYLTQRAYLDPASYYGATGLPADASVLQLSGGNPDLTPERAESWSAGAVIEPRAIPDLRLELSYFHTDYTGRVVTPLQGVAGALTNPIYQSIIIADPTTTEIAAAIAQASEGLLNYTGLPFDPANVAYIVDNRNLNAARQRISGVDAAITYKLVTEQAGDFSLSGNLTYLESSQQLLPGAASVQLAGTIYRPPHWRGRGGLVWNKASITAATFVNYVGGVEDRRFAIVDPVDSMTTVDLTLRHDSSPDGGRGVSVAFNVNNLFNAKPDRVTSLSAAIPAYDSTNYSAVGRYLGISVQAGW